MNKKNNTGGRPVKHTHEEQKILARCFLDIKKREPHVTQESYGQNYGISGRSLRRYIQKFYGLELLLNQEEELKEKIELAKENTFEASKTEKGTRSLTVLWT